MVIIRDGDADIKQTQHQRNKTHRVSSLPGFLNLIKQKIQGLIFFIGATMIREIAAANTFIGVQRRLT